MNNTPRAKTEKEVREEFIFIIQNLTKYWARQENLSVNSRCEGVAFSILCLFDGINMDFPAVDLVLNPHPDDKEYYIENDENWYESGIIINNTMLHEMLFNKES
jgi:hypothetical protein